LGVVMPPHTDVDLWWCVSLGLRLWAL